MSDEVVELVKGSASGIVGAFAAAWAFTRATFTGINGRLKKIDELNAIAAEQRINVAERLTRMETKLDILLEDKTK